MLSQINNNFNKSSLYILLISAIAISFRIVNSHLFINIEDTIPNFQGMIALCLIGSCYAKNRLSGILLPIYIMFFTDLVLGFHSLWVWTYLPYVFIAIIGRVISVYSKPKIVILGAISSPIIFFLISNFGVWTFGGYGMNFEGLVACYIAGLPFLENSIASTVLFSTIFIYMHSPFYNLYYKNSLIPT